MDKSGQIQEHSKIKLELYRLYLERYLSVLSVTPFFSSIIVNDIFAGCGVSENEENGSAIIAVQTIEKVKTELTAKSKPIYLQLNDANKANCDALAVHLKSQDFATITNMDANQYIQAWNPKADSHNLFFIDPHGYTQVSIDNLKRLFSMTRCDFLVFVPIYHIYRFLRKEYNAEQLKPIANFLRDLGINEADATKAYNLDAFTDLVTQALRTISGSAFVYRQMIQNQSHNSQYCLFFITKNILGAQKFLEAQSELKRKIQSKEAQAAFDFVADLNTESFINFIEYNKPYDNVALYEHGIKSGFLPTEIKNELKTLEKNGKVEIAELPGKKRNRGGFYNDYEHHKKQDRKILITFRE